MPEIVKYSNVYGSLSNFKEAVELDINPARYKEYKSHETACKTDWKQCADNAQLVNKWEGWVGVRVECEHEAKDHAKYGTPEFARRSFSTYKIGKNYIEDGLAVAIEPDAIFQNIFGTKVQLALPVFTPQERPCCRRAN